MGKEIRAMQDIKVHLEKLQADAAECALISNLATDRVKRELFSKLSQHLLVLASEVERAMAEKADSLPGPVPGVPANDRFTVLRPRANSRSTDCQRRTISLSISPCSGPMTTISKLEASIAQCLTLSSASRA
jgi:hypothetical protein